MIRIGDQWLADFASCNYLGFDLDREIIDAIPGYIEELGNASELVAPAGQPRPVRGDRGAPDRAARLRGLARPADDHPHPHVGDPAARGLGDDLPRRPRAQDDLRRLPGRPLPRRRGPPLPLRGPGPPGRAPPRRGRPHQARVHGRRQQHDRQRPGPEGVRRGGAPPRGSAVRRRRPRVRRHRRALPGRAVALWPQGQQRRAPRRRELRRPRPRRGLLQGVLVAARVHRVPDRGEAAAQGRRTSVPVLGALARRLARHRARRVRRQRAPGRRAAHRPVRAHRAAAGRPRPARRRDAQPLGPPHRGDPAQRTTSASPTSVTSSSTAASTSRSPPTRSFPRTRSASASS